MLSRPQQATETKTGRVPPYAVVVLNDDDHTWDYVVTAFYSHEKCLLLAKQIHEEGRAIVWSGPQEVAELKKEQLLKVGPDFFARKTVNYPLGVEIEPLS